MPEAANVNIHLRGALGKARVEKWEGRDHLVVPIVALVEGVIHAVNAEHPEYVPLPVLQAARDSWNGMPVMLGHPMKDGKPVSANEPGIKEKFGFGVIRNSNINGTKLGMEALVDIAKLESLHPSLLADLQIGEQVEVSVGALVRTAKKDGMHGKKKYKAQWLEISGDHLAMLPGGVGACSGEMGCGANRTCHLVTAEGFVEVPEGLPYMVFTTLEGQSLDDRMRAVEKAVVDKWNKPSDDPIQPAMYGAWPQQVFDDHVIVRKGDELYSCDYTVDDQGKVTLSGEVRVKQVYVAAVGARHSTKDMQVIQTVHDHAMALGAKCEPTNCARDLEAPARAIRYEGGKWLLFAKDGKYQLGAHDSEAEAVEHQRAIDARLKREPVGAR